MKRKIFLHLCKCSLLLVLVCPSYARELVCIGDVCRTVETGTAQDVNPDPPKATVKARVADVKFWLVTGVNVAVSITATKKLVDCRHDHGIGPCVDGGYGEFKARETLRQGFTGGVTLISFEIKKIEDREDNKYKFWWLLPALNSAWNASGMIRNASHSFPPRDKD